MTYAEAADAFEKQWRKGHSATPASDCVFPYDIRYADDVFIETFVPIIACKLVTVDNGRVNKYIDIMLSGDNFGPAWVAYGKRLKDGTVTRFEHGKLFVHDGNHRITARHALACFYTLVVMPMSNYQLFMREYK